MGLIIPGGFFQLRIFYSPMISFLLLSLQCFGDLVSGEEREKMRVSGTDAALSPFGELCLAPARCGQPQELCVPRDLPSETPAPPITECRE